MTLNKTIPFYLILMGSFLCFNMTQAQVDSVAPVEEIAPPDVPLETFEYSDSSVPMEWPTEEAPTEYIEEDYTPRIKTYDYQANFGFGFQNIAAPKNGYTSLQGRFLPETKFLSSQLINFELGFGRNIYKGIWRFWFGLGIEDESFTFKDANVRIQTRQDSFSHLLVTPQTPSSTLGKLEDAKTSEILMTTITVPLSIGFQDKVRRPKFKFKLGAYLGYRYSTATKVSYADGTDVTISGNLHINPIVFDPFVNVQYKNFGVYFRSSGLPFANMVGSGNEQTRTAIGIFVGL